MTKITDGVRVHECDELLSDDRGLYVLEGGLIAVYDHATERSVAISPTGMTDDEIARSIRAADTLLARAPVNRHQRRALGLH